MRKIKFKAWDVDESKMLSDWQREFGLIEHFGFNGGGRFLLLQFTGLTDKNGKEVYEGDILEIIELNRDKIEKWITPVIWEMGSFLVKGSFVYENHKDYYDTFLAVLYEDEDVDASFSILHEFEIIGNIYENANLLK